MKIGYSVADVRTSRGAPKTPADKTFLHKGVSTWRWGGYQDVLKCSRNSIMTTGRWSFRIKDWDGITKSDSVEQAFEFLTTGKIKIPMWAYSANKCSKCFPDAMKHHLVKCNSCGHERKVLDDLTLVR